MRIDKAYEFMIGGLFLCIICSQSLVMSESAGGMVILPNTRSVIAMELNLGRICISGLRINLFTFYMSIPYVFKRRSKSTFSKSLLQACSCTTPTNNTPLNISIALTT